MGSLAVKTLSAGVAWRLLGLDVGARRTGIALTDELRVAVRPLMTIGRTASLLRDAKSVGRIVRTHGVAGVVVGNPLHMSGSASAQSEKTLAFVTELRAVLDVPVVLWDERLSSVAAVEWMDRAGIARGAEQKRVLDQWSAVVILQSYLHATESERRAAAGDIAV